MRLSVKASILAAVIVSVSALGQEIPLQNWDPVPWQPTRAGKIAANGGYSTAFMPMAPCRVYDSRPASALNGLTSRTIDIDGGPCSGIPANASAYSINITVFGSASSGSYEFVTAYPAGTTRPSVSTMNFLTGTQASNAATVPAGTAGDIDIYTTYTTHFVLDINGYYSYYQNAGDGFASVSGSGVGVLGVSSSGYGVEGMSSSSYGVVGTSTAIRAAGVLGSSAEAIGVSGTSTSGNGVSGTSSSGNGVSGTSTYGRGVVGTSTSDNGVMAVSTNSDAIFASGGRDGIQAQGYRYGLVGMSRGYSGTLYGVIGVTGSAGDNSAGVLGQTPGTMPWACCIASGVRGLSKNGAGVFGLSEFAGVIGGKANPDDTAYVEGVLGWGTYGVYSWGDTGATGTKSFVEPHPTDAGKVVKYVSLEGPEAGTYFRDAVS